jgi:cellulose synthase/poly-beta-1,6-N-acetylglucosamine synthase-like glycosyltransferase
MGVAEAIVFASAAFILYVIAVYPLLLAAMTRRRDPPEPASSWLPTVSVLLPVYNGEAFLRAKLATLAALDYPAERVRILVISDGSTDATDELAASAAGQGNVELIRVPHRGKPAALNAGMARATGEVLFFTDVRQELSSNALRVLTARLTDPTVGAATGELVIRQGGGSEGAGLYWRYELLIRSRLSRIGMLQGATGCIYAMRRQDAVPVPEDILADDVYLPLAAFFRGKRIVLDPSAKAYDYPTELGIEFRRKVRTLAGVYQIVGAYPRVLWSRGWFHFASHKLGRLLLPFALLALLISSAWVSGPLRFPLIACQVCVYALALADAAIPRAFPLKRVTAAASAFVVLMAAALCAAFALLAPSRTLWKRTTVRQT